MILFLIDFDTLLTKGFLFVDSINTSLNPKVPDSDEATNAFVNAFLTFIPLIAIFFVIYFKAICIWESFALDQVTNALQWAFMIYCTNLIMTFPTFYVPEYKTGSSPFLEYAFKVDNEDNVVKFLSRGLKAVANVMVLYTFTSTLER